jgi:hypothetical protein
MSARSNAIPFALAAIVLAAGLTAGDSRAIELPANDYPTSARADYVFACMQTNGQTREALDKCSCSIDAVAALLSYDEYEAAETILSVRQKGGENVAMFNNYAPLLEKVKNLKRAQVEAELRCF